MGDYSPALVTPWPGIRQLVTAPMPQSLLKSFKLHSPKPVYPTLLSHPLETTESFLPHIFPLLSWPPDQLWCFPGCPHSHPQCGITHHTWIITKQTLILKQWGSEINVTYLIKRRTLSPWSIILRCLPSGASGNPDHHLQEHEPKAGTVDQQILTKELSKHLGGPAAWWEGEGGGSSISLRVTFLAWSALNPVMGEESGVLTTETWNCYSSPQ